MGEAKRKRERLGEWYGKPVVPGHPDYVALVKVEGPPPSGTWGKPVAAGLWRTMMLMGMSSGLAISKGPRR